MIVALKPHKDVLAPMAYAGDESLIRKELFSGDESARLDGIDFGAIPEDLFCDKAVIKKYGENLYTIRTDCELSLEQVAHEISKGASSKKKGKDFVDVQTISKIERGERKKIDRNLLLQFCVLFGKYPEELLGLIPERVGDKIRFIKPLSSQCSGEISHPLAPIEKAAAGKSWFIFNRVFYANPELCDAIIAILCMSMRDRKKVCSFLSNTPNVHILSDEKINQLIENDGMIADGFDESAPQRGNEILAFLNKLDQIGQQQPKLQTVLFSIAASKRPLQEKVIELLHISGWLNAK